MLFFGVIPLHWILGETCKKKFMCFLPSKQSILAKLEIKMEPFKLIDIFLLIYGLSVKIYFINEGSSLYRVKEFERRFPGVS